MPYNDHHQQDDQRGTSTLTEPFLKTQKEFESKLNDVLAQLNELNKANKMADKTDVDYNHLHNMKLSYIEKLQENQVVALVGAIRTGMVSIVLSNPHINVSKFQLMTQIINILGKENMTTHVASEHAADHLKSLINTYRKELLNLNLLNDSNLNELAKSYDVSSCDEKKSAKKRSRSSSRKGKGKKTSIDLSKSNHMDPKPASFLQELLDDAKLNDCPTDERIYRDNSVE
jgi:hypothetical protein